VTNDQSQQLERQSRAEKRELRMSCHSVIGHSITNPVDYNFQMGTVIGQSSYLIKIIPNKNKKIKIADCLEVFQVNSRKLMKK